MIGLFGGNVSDAADISGKEGIDSIMSAIRKMVSKETRSRAAPPATAAPVAPPEKPKRAVLVLHPHMRVDKKIEQPEVMDAAEEIPHAPPLTIDESFAIANPVVDEDMLRQMVREVVQEQLRGEIGREIIRAMKMDLIRSLEKF